MGNRLRSLYLLCLLPLVLGYQSCSGKIGFESTIVFITGEGTYVPPISAHRGTSLSAPSSPSRVGYLFAGWFKDPQCSVPFRFDLEKATNNTLLYAKWDPDGSEEIFNDLDKPLFDYVVSDGYYFRKPWNYDQANNSARKYPLFIYLHGSGAADGLASIPCFNTDEELKKYPCFVFAPHTRRNWNSVKLAEYVMDIIADNRVDTNRIYIMGYSIGGTASYGLTKELFNKHGLIVAGIVRMTGARQTVFSEEMADRTAVWYHIGAKDSFIMRLTAMLANRYFAGRKADPGFIRVKTPVKLTGVRGSTVTYARKGREMYKFTEYSAPVGHVIGALPLQDPYVLEWLFSQSSSAD